MQKILLAAVAAVVISSGAWAQMSSSPGSSSSPAGPSTQIPSAQEQQLRCQAMTGTDERNKCLDDLKQGDSLSQQPSGSAPGSSAPSGAAPGSNMGSTGSSGNMSR
jgi:hypothetical protein